MHTLGAFVSWEESHRLSRQAKVYSSIFQLWHPILSLARLCLCYWSSPGCVVCIYTGKRERSARVNKANIANGKVAPVYTRPAPVCMQMPGTQRRVSLSLLSMSLFARAPHLGVGWKLWKRHQEINFYGKLVEAKLDKLASPRKGEKRL